MRRLAVDDLRRDFLFKIKKERNKIENTIENLKTAIKILKSKKETAACKILLERVNDYKADLEDLKGLEYEISTEVR